MNEVEALQGENAELRRQIGQLITELARLSERVSELLAVAQRKHRKPAVEKPPAAPPTIERDARRAFDERPTAPEKPPEEPQPKVKAKPTGRKPIPNHLEAEAHELRASACACCGETGLDVGEEEKAQTQRRRSASPETSSANIGSEGSAPSSIASSGGWTPWSRHCSRPSR